MNEMDVEVTRHWGDLQNAVPEKEAAVRVDEPTDAGWYAYSGGNQTMVFHLRTEPRRQWTAHFGGGVCGYCEWGYIEQALGVFDLVPLRPARWDRMGAAAAIADDAVPEKDAQSRAARAAAIARDEALVEVVYGLELIARAMRAMGWDQADGVELAAQWVKTMNEAEQ